MNAINKITLPNQSKAVNESVQVSIPTGPNFKEILINYLKPDQVINSQALEAQIKEGIRFKPEQLLFYQIKASEFHLKVELVSKLAEALNSTTRRLQNSQ